MRQQDLLKEIATYLARFSEQVKILNKSGDFSINIQAENLLVRVLNIIYGLELENLNYSKIGCYTAIDLGDAGNGIAFQITSTDSIAKIKDCLEKFIRNGMYKHYKNLYIFIITNKLPKYAQKTIDEVIASVIKSMVDEGKIKDKSEVVFTFSVQNILDKSDLYKQLNANNNFEDIYSLANYLKKQFDEFWEKDYLLPYFERLKNYFYDPVMDDQNGITLDAIYTEPALTLLLRNDDLAPDQRQYTPFRYHERQVEDKISDFIISVFDGNTPMILNRSYKFVLLLGYPGQGKSSLCKKILNTYLSNNYNAQQLFYFQLKNIRQVERFIKDPIKVLYEEACTFTELKLNEFSFQNSLLILDGLDELYMRENIILDEIERLCKEIARTISKFKTLRIFLTSRYGYVNYERICGENNILCMRLGHFSYELQLSWLQKYRKYHPEGWLTPEKLKTFNNGSQACHHIKELIEQPLLLHMVASLKQEISSTTNRSYVYKQLFNELIQRKYEEDGQLEILYNISQNDLRDLLREIGFAIYFSKNEYITKNELLKLQAVKNFLGLFPEKNFRESIKGIMISFYFKEVERNNNDGFEDDTSNYAIEFLHKSLREYMTAEKIFFTIKRAILKKDNKGNNIPPDLNNVLTIVNELFGKMRMSYEIISYLNEIIANEMGDLPEKKLLADGLCNPLEQFFSQDFMPEGYNGYVSPVSNVLLTIYGYWCFISCLSPKENYLANNLVKNSIIKFLKLHSIYHNIPISNVNFNYQDLSKLDIRNVEFTDCQFISTDMTDTTFTNVKFNNCHFQNVKGNCIKIKETLFESAIFTKCDFGSSSLVNVMFKFAIINDTNFEHSEFYNIQFIRHQNYPTSRSIISNCTFKFSTIDAETYDRLKQVYPDILKDRKKIHQCAVTHAYRSETD